MFFFADDIQVPIMEFSSVDICYESEDLTSQAEVVSHNVCG